MESSLAITSVRSALQLLSAAEAHLDTAVRLNHDGQSSGAALEDASRVMKEARANMDAASAHLDANVVPPSELRDCPACGRSIRKAATLCGHCWTKLG